MYFIYFATDKLRALYKSIFSSWNCYFPKCTLLVFDVFNKIFFHVNLSHCSHHMRDANNSRRLKGIALTFYAQILLLLASKGNSYFITLCPKLTIPNFVSLQIFRYVFIIKFSLIWLWIQKQFVIISNIIKDNFSYE